MESVPEITKNVDDRMISIVEAQRRTNVAGPELMRAVVDGQIPSVSGPYGLEMVYLADVEAWATHR